MVEHEKTLTEYIQDLRSEEAKIRIEAATILGEWGNDRAVTPLIKALSHDDENLRRESARALKEIENRRAIEPLLRSVSFDTSAEVRAEAAFALGYHHKYSFDIEILHKVLDEDAHHLVRQNVVFALGKIKRRKSISKLIARMKVDDNFNVREMIAWALGEIKDKRAVPALVAALNDKYLGVRKNAAYSLGKYSDTSAIEPLKKQLLREEEAKEAAWALSRILKKKAAVSALKDAYKKHKKDNNTFDCLEICRVLLQLNRKLAENYISEMLEDGNFSVYHDELKSLI